MIYYSYTKFNVPLNLTNLKTKNPFNKEMTYYFLH